MVKVDPLKAVKSILVAVDGSAAAYNALATVCDIARHTKARVAVVHVIEVPRAQALDADLPAEAERGEAVLTEAERLGEDHRIKVHGELVQARQAGVAIVDEAAAGAVDAIALGLGYVGPFGRFQLDEVSQYVLEHAPCDVWLFRYAARQNGAQA
ncbi:MAG: universal stress protein [Dehalococcoidia bacterium]|nr:universal stress protein [Dehalococcoidia bacterium]